MALLLKQQVKLAIRMTLPLNHNANKEKLLLDKHIFITELLEK